MFDDQYQALAARRAQLITTAQAQRVALGMHATEVDRSLIWVERGWKAWQFVQRHPLLVAVPVAAVAIFKPRALQRGLQAALAVWSMRRSLRQLIKR